MKNSVLTSALLGGLVCASFLTVSAGRRPYEFDWANRTVDDHPVLLPLESAAGWNVAEAQDSAVALSTGTNRVLFGEGVLHVAYRGTGAKPRFSLRPSAPVSVPEGADTVSFWLYGNALHGKPCPSVSLSADFTDAAGKPFSISLYAVNHYEWFLVQRKCPADLKDRLAHGAKFVGLTFSGGSNKEERWLELTSLGVFQEELKPLAFKPQPKRPHRLFPEAPAGMNTGDGALPFPTRANTVIADEAVSGTVTAEQDADGTCRLVRTGEDGRLEIRLSASLRNWDGFAMRWNGSAWRRFAVGGGLLFAPKTTKGKPQPAVSETTSAWRKDGNAFVREGTLRAADGRTADVRLRLRLIGKSLAVELKALGGAIAEIRFGACVDMPDAEQIPIPYFTFRTNGGEPRASVLCFKADETPLFHLAFADWTQSNGSDLNPGSGLDARGEYVSNDSVRYNPKTDGTRNDCYERLVYAFSPVFEDVLPVVPNPPSPYRDLTADYQWCHVYLGRSRDPEYPAWRSRHRRGLRKVMIHDWETCMRDGNESFTFRTTAAPGKGGDKGMYDFTRFLCDELGYLYGPYNNCCDFAPVNGYWNADRVERFSDGNFIPSWNRCYSPRPAWCPEATDEIVSELQRKYRFNTGYCDVQTCVSPWSRTDYDARVPGGGTFAGTYYSYGLTLLRQRQNWTGPVYSEGGCHYLYCGLDDGNFAQDQGYHLPFNPWLVDFDLRRLHPLANNFGMGYHDMFYGSKGIPKDLYTRMDRFLAATVAFGHIGLFCIGKPEEEEHGYYMIQAIAGKYARANADTIRYFDAAGKPLDTSAAVARGVHARSQVTVRYADGTVTVVNGHRTDDLVIPCHGRKLVLQPCGWYALSGDKTVGVVSGRKDGHRLDVSVSPAYVYINTHKKWTTTPYGTTDGTLLRLREAGGTEEVFIWRGTTATLPYAAESVVKVNEAGAEAGPAEFAVVDGQTTIKPQQDAYSFRVRPPASGTGPLAATVADDFLVDVVPAPAKTASVSNRIELPRSHWTGYCLRGGEELPFDAEYGGTFSGPSTLSSGGVTQRGYVTHPPYAKGHGYICASWRLKLPAEAPVKLKAVVGLLDDHGKSDGVTFKVRVTDATGKRTELAALHNDQVAWKPIEADLAPWRGQPIRLTLVSDCGPADDTACDWSGWGDVRLERP